MKSLLLLTALAVLCVASTSGLGAELEFFGYYNVNPTYGVNYFYWGFQSRNNPKTDPIVLWLTGGPGCSSSLALFFENGPYKIGANGTLLTNPNSWNDNATVIFVDQPGGTGFSYVGNPEGLVTNETGVAENMYSFLQQFFTQYAQFAPLPFYITGESYGGHYVSAISRRVQLGNQGGDGKFINLQGIAIGNGWVDPEIQYASYASYAKGFNLISKFAQREAEHAYTKCDKQIKNQDWAQAFQECSQILDVVLNAAGNINPYDVTKNCTYPPLCYDLSPIGDFLNLASTKKRLGVANNITWAPCSNSVYAPLEGDFVQSFRQDLPFLLNDYRVVIYNGENDLMCNFYGTSAYLASLPWPGQAGFARAANTTWTVGSTAAGTVRTYQNLTYVTVHNAGHMVPYDQPVAALNLINNLIFNRKF